MFGLPVTPNHERVGILNMETLEGSSAGHVINMAPTVDESMVEKIIIQNSSDAGLTGDQQQNSSKGSIKSWLRKRDLSPSSKTPGAKVMRLEGNSPDRPSVKKRIYYSPSNGGGGGIGYA